MRMSDEEYAEKFLRENPPPEGVEPSDWLRDNPPPREESEDPEYYWPVDEYGDKIPMNEWTVSDMACFPDSLRDWLIKEHEKKGLKAGAELLRQLSPEMIAWDTSAANALLGSILADRGALKRDSEGRIMIPAQEQE